MSERKVGGADFYGRKILLLVIDKRSTEWSTSGTLVFDTITN